MLVLKYEMLDNCRSTIILNSEGPGHMNFAEGAVRVLVPRGVWLVDGESF